MLYKNKVICNNKKSRPLLVLQYSTNTDARRSTYVTAELEYCITVGTHMAGCKGGKNIVEIRRSGTKRQQNLNIVNEPMEHRKKWRGAFRALVIRQ